MSDSELNVTVAFSHLVTNFVVQQLNVFRCLQVHARLARRAKSENTTMVWKALVTLLW